MTAQKLMRKPQALFERLLNAHTSPSPEFTPPPQGIASMDLAGHQASKRHLAEHLGRSPEEPGSPLLEARQSTPSQETITPFGLWFESGPTTPTAARASGATGRQSMPTEAAWFKQGQSRVALRSVISDVGTLPDLERPVGLEISLPEPSMPGVTPAGVGNAHALAESTREGIGPYYFRDTLFDDSPGIIHIMYRPPPPPLANTPTNMLMRLPASRFKSGTDAGRSTLPSRDVASMYLAGHQASTQSLAQRLGLAPQAPEASPKSARQFTPSHETISPFGLWSDSGPTTTAAERASTATGAASTSGNAGGTRDSALKYYFRDTLFTESTGSIPMMLQTTLAGPSEKTLPRLQASKLQDAIQEGLSEVTRLFLGW